MPKASLPCIAVAVSGGADSLYTLLSLKEAGYPLFALHGIFGQPLLAEFTEYLAANGGTDHTTLQTDGANALQQLQEKCAALGIPLHIVDFSDLFIEKVVRPFVQAFAHGATPNPCALCNAEIKFGLLLEKALELRADILATGHYSQLVTLPQPPFEAGDKEQLSEGAGYCFPVAGQVPALLQGTDASKDQSYFLALTPATNLARAIFPLGSITKSEVLATLEGRGITPPVPGESQEICFIPGTLYREFLPFMAKKLGIALPGEGAMLLPDGKQPAMHRGLWNYTEGQRRGLGVAWSEPLYVLGKDAGRNTLHIGPKPALRCDSLFCAEMNILFPPHFWPAHNAGNQAAEGAESANSRPHPAYRVWVKTRYRSTLRQATVTLDSSINPARPGATVCFQEPDAAVAPGQLCALYIPATSSPDSPMRLVAGGIITSVAGAW